MFKKIFTKNVLIAWVVALVLQSLFHPTFMEMFLLSLGLGFIAGALDRKEDNREGK